jgi:general secretion pathway protein F
MPMFRYSAIGRAGDLVEGVMEAPDEATVVASLQRQGRLPVRAEPAQATSGLARLLNLQIGGRRTLRRQETTDMTRELAIMLSAGQSLDRALRFLVETAPGTRVRAVLDDLRDAVRDGSSLTTALARHPASFSRLYVGLVRAGEAGGNLGGTLEHLATLLERQRALASTVISALIYPALLVVAAIGSITLMLTEILPQFVPLFAENGARLPTSTRLLIEAGAFVGSYGLLILLAVLVVGFAARPAQRQPELRLIADRLVLRIPVVGGIWREVLAARFTRTLGTLIGNGVPLIGALDVVREAIGNRAAVAAIDAATLAAKGGGALALSLRSANVFPARTIHLLQLGEENAQLAQMAIRAAVIHEEKTRIGVQRLVSLLVPAITIVMGSAIAGIVASLLMAMLGLNDLAQ